MHKYDFLTELQYNPDDIAVYGKKKKTHAKLVHRRNLDYVCDAG